MGPRTLVRRRDSSYVTDAGHLIERSRVNMHRTCERNGVIHEMNVSIGRHFHIAGVTALVALLTACSAAPSPTPTVEPTPALNTLTGTLALTDSEAFARFDDEAELAARGEWCASQSTHGYTDIAVGTQIVVKDETGSILGTGTAIGGEVTGGGVYDSERDACVWTFSVDDLTDAEFYTVEAGRRGGPTYSRADLEAMDWDVALEIGN